MKKAPFEDELNRRESSHLKLFMTTSAALLLFGLPYKIVSTQRHNVLPSPTLSGSVIDMHRNWKIMNFVCAFVPHRHHLHHRVPFFPSPHFNLWQHFSFNLFWIRESRSKAIDKPINEFISCNPVNRCELVWRRIWRGCSEYFSLAWWLSPRWDSFSLSCLEFKCF